MSLPHDNARYRAVRNGEFLTGTLARSTLGGQGLLGMNNRCRTIVETALPVHSANLLTIRETVEEVVQRRIISLPEDVPFFFQL